MNEKELEYVQVRIGYRFKNQELLVQAFTRSSYASENGGGDNEILEFIGDKALDLAVVKFLAEKYGSFADPKELSQGIQNHFYSDYDEGVLTEIKASMVQKKTLARRIEYLGFEDFLIMGKGDEAKQINKVLSVKEDLFEAIIGAVAIDSEWDLNVIYRVAENMLEYSAQIDDADDTVNYIGRLQDWALAKEGSLPIYCVEKYHEAYMYMEYTIKRNRPINAPRPQYLCNVRLPDIKWTFVGFGDSQNEARMDVAKLALEYIEEHGLQFTIKDEIPNPNLNEAINQLEILSRRGYFSMPTYDFEEKRDENGKIFWKAKCHVEGYGVATSKNHPAKTMAKKNAAFKMLTKILESE